MDIIWFCFTSVLSITVISGQNIDVSHIRVFPGVNMTIAGIVQISSLNDRERPQYTFSASEARRLCLSLGVNIASKAQVQEALKKGLETCRFGWIDENLAVIPRIKALSNCGQSQTGLVTWRASLTQKFDVFCFNESDAELQLKDAPIDPLLSSRDHSGQTTSAQTTHSTSSSSTHPPPYSVPELIDSEMESASYTGSAQGAAGGMTILITSTCAVILTAIVIFAYLKLRGRCAQKSDMECVKTEDWTCVKEMKDTGEDAQEDERIEVDENAS